jgi:hypothetical protein
VPLDPKPVHELFLAAASYHEPAHRAAILDRECLFDSELRLRLEALLEAYDQINNSFKRPRVGSDDRDMPWLAWRSLASRFLQNLEACFPRSGRSSCRRCSRPSAISTQSSLALPSSQDGAVGFFLDTYGISTLPWSLVQ